jgi:uncharacterized protein
MVEKTKHEPGTFCWVELGTSDRAAAKKFYTSLFGWTFEDMPGSAGVYTILRKNGNDAAALYELGPQQAGAPPSWASYVRVERADDAVAHAKELGATVLMGPFDAAEHGRMAVIRDPAGAVFSIWEPRANPGAGVVNEPGAFCWNELYTLDPKRASDFYTGLFGWTINARHMDFGEYVIFEQGTSMTAGMMQVPKEWGPVPPHWLVYFAVENCDTTFEKAKSLGAGVTVPPFDVENVGRMSILTDPQGAGFAVIKLKMP